MSIQDLNLGNPIIPVIVLAAFLLTLLHPTTFTGGSVLQQTFLIFMLAFFIPFTTTLLFRHHPNFPIIHLSAKWILNALLLYMIYIQASYFFPKAK